MKLSLLSILTVFFSFFLFSAFVYSQGLIVNELSNGPSGSKEYYELLVIGPPCTTVDLRNWIVDDNNGDFGPGGVPALNIGIAQGHIRFKNIANWSAVPVGSLIVIYNELDKNAAITQPDDATDSNKDCVFILPGNNANLESCDTFPNVNSGSYGPCAYQPSGYTFISLRNEGDAGQVRMPSGAYFHGISFGDIAGGPDNLLINAANGTGNYYFFNNNGSYTNKANYSFAAAAGGGQTPGAANNAANKFYIDSLKTNTLLVNLGNDTSVCQMDSIVLNAGAGFTAYNWSTGDTTQTKVVYTTGTYWVTVGTSDSCGSCTGRDTIVITSKPLPVPSTLSTNISCNGLCNGSVNLSVSNGTSPYSFVWSNSATTEDIALLCTGNYTVTITDSAGCTTTTSSAISQPAVLTASATAFAANCNGICNGSLTASATGGTTNYTFVWSGGLGSGASKTGVCAGSYTVTVTDSKGCTAIANSTVTQPAALTAVATATAANCNGICNGFVNATSGGGTTGYSYIWSGGIGSGASKTNVCAGTYTVTSTDANGCTATSSTTVTEPVVLSGTMSCSDVSTTGAGDGSTSVTPSGGTTVYTYLWSTGATTQSLTGLSGGLYNVTVTDSKGCTLISSCSVNEPICALAVPVVTKTNVTCNGVPNGSITITESGGTTPYTYTWSPNVSTTSTATGLTAGNYFVTVTDSVGCSRIATATITTPSALSLSVTSTNVLCNGVCNGTLSASSSGGTTSYSYSWSGGLGTGVSKSGVCAGSYTVTATDANGCNAIANATVTQPAALTTAATASAANCGQTNGTATINVSGGIPAYAFSWSNGQSTSTTTGLAPASYSVTVTDNNLCTAMATIAVSNIGGGTATITGFTNPSCSGGNNGMANVSISSTASPFVYQWSSGGTSSTATGLSAGTHSVTVTDSVGCLGVTSVTLNAPPAIVSTVNTTDAPCKSDCDGTATLVTSGGVSPYTYSWNNSQSTSTATGLCQGIYTAIITDANGCTISKADTVKEPELLSFVFGAFNTTCYGACNGQALVIPSGGGGNYIYNWQPMGIVGINIPVINNLCPGTDTLTITDANGCFIDTIFVISQPAAFVISTSSTPSQCAQANGIASVDSVLGGTGNITYLWDSAAFSQTTKIADSLPTGTYCVTITDANNCDTFVCVTLSNVSGPTLSVTSSAATCNGKCDGTASANATGGKTPYTYQWSGGSSTGLCSGSYKVTVTDANNCKAIDSVIITQPASLVITVSGDKTICKGDSVVISATAIGGTGGPYIFYWNNGSMPGNGPFTLSPSADTCYTAYARDGFSCTSSPDTVCISVFPAVSINASANPDTICQGDSVVLNSAGSGGNGSPFAYSWSIGGINVNDDTVKVSPPGSFPDTVIYKVAVTDGCSNDSTSVAVHFYPNPVASAPLIKANGCAPYTLNILYSSGAGISNCKWNMGDGNIVNSCNSFSYTYKQPGNFFINLQVTSQNGCSSSNAIPGEVSVNKLPDAGFVYTPDTGTLLNSQFKFTDKSKENVAQWEWTFYNHDGIAPLDTSTLKNPFFEFPSDTGVYPVSLIVTDTAGCKDTLRVNVYIRGEFSLFIANAFTPNGDGKNDTFFPQGIGIDPNNFIFYIFDRWGELIFVSYKLDEPWNGIAKAKGGSEVVQDGVYVWKLVVKPLYGDIKNKSEYIGHVTLLK